METINVVLLLAGLLVLVLGLLAEPLKRSFLSTPLVALAVGVALGPKVTGALELASWGSEEAILEQVARLTVALSLMAIPLRLPQRYVRSHRRPLALLVGPLMLAMWLASGLLAYGLLGLSLGAALLVGAVVTPTDPVVASSIVTGRLAERSLPARLRHLLSGESGANDALAYPIVLLCVLLLGQPASQALPEWLLRVVLWEVLVAAGLGAAAGYGAGLLLERAESHHTIERTSYLVYAIALTLAVLGGARLLGTDGLLAVFTAGLGLSRVLRESERLEEQNVQEAVNSFLTLPAFALLGLALPWEAWGELGGAGIALALAVLALRRLPALLALHPGLDGVRGLRDALFLGWFGPVGVAALFYAQLAVRKTGVEAAWEVGSLVIVASVVAHGASAAPFTKLYARSRSR